MKYVSEVLLESYVERALKEVPSLREAMAKAEHECIAEAPKEIPMEAIERCIKDIFCTEFRARDIRPKDIADILDIPREYAAKILAKIEESCL